MSGDCKKFRKMIDRYADLGESEMRLLEAHTLECEACADELAFLRAITESAHSLPEIETPTDFLDKLNDRLDRELQQPKPVPVYKRAVPYVQRYGALAACLAVGIAIGANSDTLMGKLNGDTSDIVETTQTSDVPMLPTEDTAAAEPTAADAPVTTTAVQEPVAATTAPTTAKAPVTAATKAPTVNKATTKPTAPTAKPASSAPKAATTAPTVAAAPTTAAKTVTEAPKAAEAITADVPVAASEPIAMAQQPAAARALEPMGRGIDVYSYIAPSDSAYYAAAVPEETPETEHKVSGYEIKEQQNSSFAYNSPFVSSITISEKDAARVKELVDVFVEGSYGGLYMITSQDLEILLRQMDKEGIHYTDALSEQGENITFKLVIT